MLSAVESHLGSGRSYFAGPAYPPLLPPAVSHHTVHLPTALPVVSATGIGGMSTAEFVRPHPKTRYNNGAAPPAPPPVRNGLSSPRSKYPPQPDQNGPVNLVCPSSSPSASTSPSSNSMSPKEERQPSPKEHTSPHSSVAQVQQHPDPYSPSRLSAAAYATSPLNNASLYYNYLRYPPMYHAPSPSANALAARSLAQRPPYLTDPYTQLPAVPSFLSSVPYGGGGAGPGPQPGITAPQMMPTQLPGLQTTTQSGKVMDPRTQPQQQSPLSQQPPIPQMYSTKEVKMPKNEKNVNNVSPGFKVPSGKEGSMKHRILTRPYDKETKQRSPTYGTNGHSISVARSINYNYNNNHHHNNNNNSINNNNNNTVRLTPEDHFRKGNVIQLANGGTRRVEELRSEDFIESVKRVSGLELANSTVVKLTPSAASSQTVIITFSYDNNNLVELERAIDLPFFVYGKGWSSCSPEATLQQHGLKCQLLQVGDISISLKQIASQPIEDEVPQNLSSRRCSPTVPTTATATAVSSRPAPSLLHQVDLPSDAVQQQQQQPPPPPPSFAPAYTNHFLEMQRSFALQQMAIEHGRRPLSHEAPLHERFSAIYNDHPTQPIPMVVNKALGHLTIDEEEASRKRRWSVPDNFCNDQ